MAWICYPLRRATVAVLVLCAVSVSLVSAVSTSDFTASEQSNTLGFLHGIMAANPSIGVSWSGTDFRMWPGISCIDELANMLDFAEIPVTPPFVLSEVPDDVNGSEVVLEYLEATNVTFRGTLPNSWGSLTRLQDLTFVRSALAGTLPASLGNLTDLIAIAVCNTQVSGSVPASWGALNRLTSLYLNSNALAGSIPEEWGRMPRLSVVDLRNNSFGERMPSGWPGGHTTELYYVTQLSSSDCATAKECLSTTNATNTTNTTTSTTAEPTTPTITPVRCVVAMCVACAEGSSTVCARCLSNYRMGASNTTCNGSSGVTVPLAAVLVSTVVLLSSVTLLM